MRDTPHQRAAVTLRDAELQEMETLLKIDEVARVARVSTRTVWRDIKRRKLQIESQQIVVRHRVRVRISVAKRYAMTK